MRSHRDKPLSTLEDEEMWLTLLVSMVAEPPSSTPVVFWWQFGGTILRQFLDT